MVLLDKGFYDYEFSTEDAPHEYHEKTPEELHSALAMFGIGTEVPRKPETEEEIQEHIIKQMEE